MKKYWGSRHVTPALEKNEWSGPRAGLDVVAKRNNPCPMLGVEPLSSIL
jgi:hypothetical protein